MTITEAVFKALKENWGTREHLAEIKKHNESPAPILKCFPIKESR